MGRGERGRARVAGGRRDVDIASGEVTITADPVPDDAPLRAAVDAVVILIVGAIHGQVLPRIFFSPPGTPVGATPADVPGRLAQTILAGIGLR